MSKRDHPYQQLHAVNETLNLAEELAARVKDPLWFLARQWQTGEFEAENGGRAATLRFQSQASRFHQVTLRGDGTHPQNRPLDPDIPLEAVIEAEENGESEAWSKQALEYVFDVSTPNHTLRAEDYHGNALDWFHFEMDSPPKTDNATTQTQQHDVFPTQINFAGAPHPRWWRFEEGDSYFDAPEDAEPNALSQLIPEFFYLDVNNWYLAPVELPSGAICTLQDVYITDSFGIRTKLEPVSDKGWRMFELSTRDDSQNPQGQMMTPNISLEILHNDTIEDIRFIRDEDANLVWAVERLVSDEAGNRINNADGHHHTPSPDADDNANLPEFRLSTEAPPHWIPYVPRIKQNNTTAPQGEMYLRRARTREEANAQSPQYRAQVIKESKRLNEEEIPRTGLRLRRIQRYARGSDGAGHFWTGRTRTSGRESGGSGLKFDILKD